MNVMKFFFTFLDELQSVIYNNKDNCSVNDDNKIKFKKTLKECNSE